MSGPVAQRWRVRTIENDEDEVKKQFDEYVRNLIPEGVTADFDHFLGLDDYHSQLMAIVKLSGNMGTATGKRIFLPGVFFEARGRHPFVEQEKPWTPVDMEFADQVQDQVVYRVPDTYTVESAPPDTKIPWTGHAVFVLHSNVDKNQIQVTRSLARGFTIVPAKDYKDLRDFYQKVSTADQEQLVLTAAKSDVGN
jgi:hypothetical protein